jgi:hypothetical protein
VPTWNLLLAARCAGDVALLGDTGQGSTIGMTEDLREGWVALVDVGQCRAARSVTICGGPPSGDYQLGLNAGLIMVLYRWRSGFVRAVEYHCAKVRTVTEGELVVGSVRDGRCGSQGPRGYDVVESINHR